MTAKISRPTAAAGGPARKITVQKQSSNRYVLLAVKILLALIIFLLLPKLIESRRSTMKKFNYRNKRQRRLAEVVLKETRLICEMHICRAIIAEEAMNCVQVCISPAVINNTTIWNHSKMENLTSSVPDSLNFVFKRNCGTFENGNDKLQNCFKRKKKKVQAMTKEKSLYEEFRCVACDN